MDSASLNVLRRRPEPSFLTRCRWTPAFAGVLMLAACNSEANPPKREKAVVATPEPKAPPALPAKPQGVTIAEQDDLVDFKFSWPSEAAAIPAIDAEMRAHAAEHLKKSRAGSQQEREARAGSDLPITPFAFEAEWKVMGQNARFLSLAAMVYEFTGGAHGNTHYDVLLWDKTANTKRPALDLFADRAAATAHINATYCPLLDAQRAKKREETLPLQGEGWEVECPDASKYPIAPVDADSNGTFEILRALLPPYEAGPYAEGTYEVDIPVNDRMRTMIKPEYREAF